MQTSSHGLKYAISIILRKVAIYDLAWSKQIQPPSFPNIGSEGFTVRLKKISASTCTSKSRANNFKMQRWEIKIYSMYSARKLRKTV